jgi:hypothetical protein
VQEHVTEQRVGEPQFELAVDPAHVDDAPPLQAPQHVVRHQAAQHRADQGLTERHQLQGVALGLVEGAEPPCDQVPEPDPGPQRPMPTPDPGILGQSAGCHPLVDQLAQEERVAAGDVEQPASGGAVDRPAQRGA